MIYLIDRGFRIKSALNILVNQCKHPGIYNECFCLGCKDKDKYNDNQGRDKVLGSPTCVACHEQSSFADGNDLRSSIANNYNDKANNDNNNVNDNDLRSSFANNDLKNSFANNGNDNNNGNNNGNVNVKDNNDNNNFIYLTDEKHQRGKPNSFSDISNTFSIIINEDLQSRLNDDNITTEATLPENFRCIISGPRECGKKFLLKKLILASIYFDMLHIIGRTGDQYHGTCSTDEGLESVNPKASIEFFEDIKGLPSPDKLPKDLRKLMIIDDVRAKEPVINEYFCRGRHNNCNMIYLNQNLFTIDRQSVRENCILFILFEQREP